ncbi:hypothetical protein HK098_003287 [Nowakowskiella sp. JEL0407]|nr:hypothetical protein HK098_003287 [Nowakowskiella sp. JEL0407]
MKTLLKVSIAATAAYTAAWIVLWISTPTKLRKKKISTKSTDEKPVYNFFDIPGPTGVPLFGSLFSFVPYVLRNRADLYFTFLHKVHGTILKFNILGKYIFLVSDAKLIKSLTNNTSDAIIRDDQLAIAANGVFDNSLFIIPSGPIWKKHRKGIQPAFGPYHLREVSKICLNKADELLDIWTESLVDGKTHRNVQQDFHVMAGDIIVKFALDADFGALKKLKENSVSQSLWNYLMI